VALNSKALNNTTFQVVGPMLNNVTTTDPTVNALIEADGELSLQASNGAWSMVDLQLLVDGVAQRAVRTSVLNAGPGNNSSSWAVHMLMPLSPGTHTICITAKVLVGTQSVTVNFTNPGRLSVVLLK